MKKKKDQTAFYLQMYFFPTMMSNIVMGLILGKNLAI